MINRASDTATLDFLTQYVQELYQCPVLFLNKEKVVFRRDGKPVEVEVKCYCVMKTTAAQRCFVWLDPFAPSFEPHGVAMLASFIVTTPCAAVRTWLDGRRASAR